MAATWIEQDGFVQASANPPKVIYKGKVVGAKTYTEAHVAAVANSPSTFLSIYGTLFRQDVKVDHITHTHWMAEVPYGKRNIETGSINIDFDTTGATVHITQAKEEVGRFPSSDAPDQFGVIGVDGEQITGTDIIIPSLKMNVTYRHPEGELTIAQIKFLSNITGTTNSTTFLTFAAGEVLFLGARGADGTDSESSVTYQFAMSPNITSSNSLTMGEIADIVKKGHEVAWVRYEDTVQEANGKNLPIKKPKFVYVNRVYDAVDMAGALGFGGAA